MKEKWLTILIVGFLALGLAFTGCGEDDDDDEPVPVTTGTISGTVTDADGGAALPDALVELKESSADGVDTTDAEGKYMFEDIEADTVTLAVSLADYISQTNSSVIVKAEDTVFVDFELKLIPPDFVGVWDVTAFCYIVDPDTSVLPDSIFADKKATFDADKNGAIDLYVEVDTLGNWDWEAYTFTWEEATEAGKITIIADSDTTTVEWTVADDAMTLNFTADEVEYEIEYAKQEE